MPSDPRVAVVLEHLRAHVDDPMWADHAEVSKNALRAAMALVQTQDGKIQLLERRIGDMQEHNSRMAQEWTRRVPSEQVVKALVDEVVDHYITGYDDSTLHSIALRRLGVKVLVDEVVDHYDDETLHNIALKRLGVKT